MKLLITGSAGFIGSHLIEFFEKLQYDVIGLDRAYQNTTLRYKKIDICDQDSLETLFKQHKFDRVIHLAAVGSVPKSFDSPFDTLNSNVIGFSNIIQMVIKYKIPKLVYASSSSVYGDDSSNVKCEGSIGKQLSPYAMTKYSNELLAEMFAQKYNFQAIGLRFFNVYGQRQKLDSIYGAVVPRFISSIKNNKLVEIYGDGNQTRSFTYVKDVVDACLLAAVTDIKKPHDVFNVAAERAITVYELFKIIANQLYRKDYTSVKFLPKREGEILHSSANILKIKRDLNWEPKHNVFQGINKTIYNV